MKSIHMLENPTESTQHSLRNPLGILVKNVKIILNPFRILIESPYDIPLEILLET